MRQKILQNAGNNEGLKENLKIQFEAERQRAKKVIEAKMRDYNQIQQKSARNGTTEQNNTEPDIKLDKDKTGHSLTSKKPKPEKSLASAESYGAA